MVERPALDASGPVRPGRPVLGHDVGFYVFTLPLLERGAAWLLALLAVSLIGSVLLYALGGRLGLNARAGRFVGPDARRHLGVLVAAVFAVLARGAWLDARAPALSAVRHHLRRLVRRRRARMPAARVLFAVALAGAVLSLCYVARALAPVLVAIALYVRRPPSAARLRHRAPAIRRHAERAGARDAVHRAQHRRRRARAFALDRVERARATGDATLTRADIAAIARRSTTCVSGITSRCSTRSGSCRRSARTTTSSSVDNDRYASTARYRQVMLSARELNPGSLPNRTWINERLTFTHGYGLTLGPVNQVTSEGLPVLFVRTCRRCRPAICR